MREQHYYDEPYLREYDSRVSEVTEKGLVLEATIAYAEGGGQPGDRGCINGVPFTNTIHEGEHILHLMDASSFSKGDEVRIVLDWKHRYEYMQQHTAQHLLSGLMFSKFGIGTLAVHQGEDILTIETDREDIPEETMEVIRIANIGDSENMRVGEQVVAIGNALGYGQSVTTGIISAKDRTIRVQESYYSDVTEYTDLIQTDAAINPGNSGGALVNMNGELIGINSAKASSSGVEGMGYSIPVSKAMPILEKLMNRKTRTEVDAEKIGYMGISGDGVSYEATSLYGIPAGIYITNVGSDTPAEAAGLRESDIITAFDGEKVNSMAALQDLLRYYEAGEEVELTVQTAKDGAYVEETLTITLGNRSDYQY